MCVWLTVTLGRLYLETGASPKSRNHITEAVFRHDLLVKSGELATEFTRSFPFTHAQPRGRFSAQMHSQLHQILRIIQTRGGAAGCSRHRQDVCVTAISQRDFLFVCVCRALKASSLSSPGFLRTYYSGARWSESLETVERLTLTFAFTHAPPPEKVWRNCRAQCMSESSLRCDSMGLCNSTDEELQSCKESYFF